MLTQKLEVIVSVLPQFKSYWLTTPNSDHSSLKIKISIQKFKCTYWVHENNCSTKTKEKFIVTFYFLILFWAFIVDRKQFFVHFRVRIHFALVSMTKLLIKKTGVAFATFQFIEHLNVCQVNWMSYAVTLAFFPDHGNDGCSVRMRNFIQELVTNTNCPFQRHFFSVNFHGRRFHAQPLCVDTKWKCEIEEKV